MIPQQEIFCENSALAFRFFQIVQKFREETIDCHRIVGRRAERQAESKHFEQKEESQGERIEQFILEIGLLTL